ncbi:hypothetical protein ACH5RR_016818 [Cinchona calisaya]|uniref:Clp R domain-containing protein n=1 Tax=Cinchona calisaya TaxID=153742 RepID=A0ABD2ZY34_9GENT
MPTPVNTARQCLTQESEQALDEAVAVARRRGHAQTTSLHMVSSLLSLPSSSLREACSRARNNAYSTRIQFKALDLCLSVSLDRLPSTPNRVEEPPVSNSLMAAIKRSQANQRRQPDMNIHQFYQQQNSSSSSSISLVKVELQNLILSILDDPVVSRVFGESGFRSCEIKIAILRPLHHQMFRYSRYKGPPPPLFLYNINGDNELGRRGFSFPFMGFSGVLDGEENCRRIGEIMVMDNGRRNPLLVGACASDALITFLEMVQKRRVLPLELSGLGVVSVESEILRFVNGNSEEGLLKLKFQEVDRMVENCVGSGVVVNFGDLKAMAAGDDDASVHALRIVVCELAKLVEIHGGKLWLIGSAARYETYLKFLNTFPSVEKDLDLQLLPITTLRLSMGDSCPRSSLMESFVPFGGFFSSPSEMKSSLSSLDQSISRCQLCNEKCNEEVSVLSSGGLITSAANLHPSSLPSWLQMTDFTTHSDLDNVKAKDDRVLLSTKIAGLHKKWDNICQRLHHSLPLPKTNSGQLGTQITPVVGFQVPEDGKINVKDDYDSGSPASTPSTQSDSKNIIPFMSKDIPHFFTTKANSPTSSLSKAGGVNFLTKFHQIESPSKVIEDHGLSSPFNSAGSIVQDGLTSPTSVTSLTVDLNLGISSSCASEEPEKPTNNGCMGLVQNFSSCLSAKPDINSRNISSNSSKSLSYSHPATNCELIQKDFKTLYSALAKRVNRQEEAVKIISHAIAHCSTTNERHHGSNRGDIWFNFVGPDRLAKKELAIALAEILHGSRENLIHVDLSSPDEIMHSTAIFNLKVWNDHNVAYRGKNVVDYIAEKLFKKPFSVLLLENVDKADLLVQNSLSKAVKTGRFSDSHGREFGIGNAIFVTTLESIDGEKNIYPGKVDFSEEDILTVKGLPIQMMIGFDLGDYPTSHKSSMLDTTSKGSSTRIFMNKRKLIGHRDIVEQCGSLEMAKRAHRESNTHLDLNFPAETGEMFAGSSGISECDSVSESCRTWLEEFLGQVDATVTFKPFDFDRIAQTLLEDISECFQRIVCSQCSLEIDSRVMMQMVAAAYLTDNKNVENWVQCVLSRGFEEAQEKYSLTSRSIIKLVVCEGVSPEEQTPLEFLPSRIILN